MTITEPNFTITPGALGTVQEAAYGAGVNVTETIHTTNIAGPVYWGVMTAQGWVESPQFYAATLDANGNVTISAHLAHTGDYIAVATSLTNPALLVSSAPVTITEPNFTITPGALGTVQEAAYGAGGVTIAETIHTTSIAGPIYWGVMTAQGWVESPQFYAATLDANGNVTITAHLDNTGDYIDVATSLTNPALLVSSTPITITNPSFSITPAALGTVQEAAYGAGGVTITETIHTTNIAGPIYWGVMTAQGWVESPQFYAATLDANGNVTIAAHLAHTGDYIAVATSLTNPALLVSSSPITITEPSFTITPAALGTVREAAYGAGVTITETIHTTNIAGPIYWGVMTAQGWVESPQFYAATLDANGNVTISAHLAHTGDYIAVATSLTNPALLVSSAPVTITEPNFTITPAALGTVQEAAYGAGGVTITETIHTTNIAGPIYWGVMTAQGWVESPQFYAATLDANGNVTIAAHLAHTGDYIAVATSLTNPALLVSSSPITITEPSFTITPAALGTVREAAYGAGVTITETIHTTNIAGPIYWGVMTAQGWVESPQFYAATLDANGNVTITAHLAHTGDYIDVATSLTNPALLVSSAPVTITEPSFTITPAALGTVQEAAYGAGGVTITETIHTTNIAGPIYWGVMTAQGWVESPQFYAATLDANGNVTITAHLDNTGDYIDVATSLTNPALLVSSTPITITNPSFSITPAALGTVQEAAYGAGVTITEAIHTTNIAGLIYWGVMTAQGWVESPQFYAATLDANGNVIITAHLDHTGDYIDIATSLTDPALLVSSTPITITEPSFTITPAALGTVQEAAYGAGVNITETIHTTNIAGPIYWGVMTAQGWVESPQFYAATLDANGNVTISAHLAHTGDYIAVATSLTNPALLVSSAPVTITEPNFTITPGALGTVQEAAYGAGVNVTETIHTTNIAGPIYWGVMTAQGWVESPQFYAATLDANGNVTIAAHLAHTGDYIAVATSLTNPALLVSSAPVTITEAPIIENGSGVSLTEGSGNFTVTGNASNSSLALGAGNQTVSLTGSGDTVTVGGGNSTISVGSGANVQATGGLLDTTTITATGGGNQLDVFSGMAFLNSDGSAGNIFFLEGPNQGLTTVTGFSMNNTDALDLANTVAGLGVASNLSNLGTYVTTSTSGGNTTLLVDPTGGHGTPAAFAVLDNTTATLSQLIAGHHITLA